MSEKDKEKKVIFRVNLSNKGKMPDNQIKPQMVTEWNIMRIAMVGAVMIILIAVGINILRDEDESVATGNKGQIKEANTDIIPLATKGTEPVVSKVEKQAATILTQGASQPDKEQMSPEKSAQIPGGLVRAQLAKGIWENEPFGDITSPIKVNNEEATGIFYFTELEDMKGKTIFHIWKYKGDVIFKKKRDVQKNSWKTYTSKLFTRRSVGSWTVETVDSDNRQLNIIYFDVASVN